MRRVGERRFVFCLIALMYGLLSGCAPRRPLYSLTVQNATSHDITVSITFPGYSAKWPVAAGGKAGELEVRFAMPRSAEVTWSADDGATHRQVVVFPTKWAAQPKSGDGLLFTITDIGPIVTLEIMTAESYYPKQIELYRPRR